MNDVQTGMWNKACTIRNFRRYLAVEFDKTVKQMTGFVTKFQLVPRICTQFRCVLDNQMHLANQLTSDPPRVFRRKCFAGQGCGGRAAKLLQNHVFGLQETFPLKHCRVFSAGVWSLVPCVGFTDLCACMPFLIFSIDRGKTNLRPTGPCPPVAVCFTHLCKSMRLLVPPFKMARQT